MAGIKETLEMQIASNELTLALAPIVKDGFQFKDDISALIEMFKSNEAVKSALSAAIDKASEIPAEVKDLDMLESFQLARVQLDYMPRLIQAYAKDPK